MKGLAAHLANLSDAQRQLVLHQRQLFNQLWRKGLLADQIRELTALEESVRAALLIELVQEDLRQCWQMGERLPVEHYLEAHPQLGTCDTAPVCLVHAEYEARSRCEPPLDLGAL